MGRTGTESAGEPTPVIQALITRFQAGKRVALARAISVVEDERTGFQALLHAVLTEGLKAHRVGLTGPPGAGKSTLLAALSTDCRARGEEVGVVAVDPTSPYSGGALLGDRIRMNDLALDPGIFIRSMATRGSLGGLATTTKEVIDLMDAFGFDRIHVETVGVGQTELDITKATDTVVVVLVPESGDGIQAMKAGLMEIADIFVVNKSDRPGSDRLVMEIRQALHLKAGRAMGSIPAHHGLDLSRMGRKLASTVEGAAAEEAAAPDRDADAPFWEIPVIQTVAQTGDGVTELEEAIGAHRAYLEASGELEVRRRARARIRIQDVAERELRRMVWSDPRSEAVVEEGLDELRAGTETPYSLARRLIERVLEEPE